MITFVKMTWSKWHNSQGCHSSNVRAFFFHAAVVGMAISGLKISLLFFRFLNGFDRRSAALAGLPGSACLFFKRATNSVRAL